MSQLRLGSVESMRKHKESLGFVEEKDIREPVSSRLKVLECPERQPNDAGTNHEQGSFRQPTTLKFILKKLTVSCDWEL